MIAKPLVLRPAKAPNERILKCGLRFTPSRHQRQSEAINTNSNGNQNSETTWRGASSTWEGAEKEPASTYNRVRSARHEGSRPAGELRAQQRLRHSPQPHGGPGPTDLGATAQVDDQHGHDDRGGGEGHDNGQVNSCKRQLVAPLTEARRTTHGEKEWATANHNACFVKKQLTLLYICIELD